MPDVEDFDGEIAYLERAELVSLFTDVARARSMASRNLLKSRGLVPEVFGVEN